MSHVLCPVSSVQCPVCVQRVLCVLLYIYCIYSDMKIPLCVANKLIVCFVLFAASHKLFVLRSRPAIFSVFCLLRKLPQFSVAFYLDSPPHFPLGLPLFLLVSFLTVFRLAHFAFTSPFRRIIQM